MPEIKQLKRYEYTFSHELSDVITDITEQFRNNPDKMPVAAMKNSSEIRIEFALPLEVSEEEIVKSIITKYFPELKFKGVQIRLMEV